MVSVNGYDDGRLLLLCDVSHRVLRADTALQVIANVVQFAKVRRRLFSVLGKHNNLCFLFDPGSEEDS